MEPQEGRPPAIYPILCPGRVGILSIHPPSLRCWLGQVVCPRFSFCSLQSSSANPRLALSFAVDLVPRFCGGGGAESRERPQTR